MRTLYVLVFIEIGSRRVYFAGCTTNPNKAWVTQQARQMMWELEDREQPIRFLRRDNDGNMLKPLTRCFVRKGLSNQNPISSAERECLCREMDTFCQRRVSGQSAGDQPGASATGHARVCGVFQHSETSSRDRATHTSTEIGRWSVKQPGTLSKCAGRHHPRLLPRCSIGLARGFLVVRYFLTPTPKFR